MIEVRLGALHFSILLAGMAVADDAGRVLFSEHCAECHGKNGEGVEDEVDEPLWGERSLESLARYIDKRMPEDKPEELDADQSRVVADYIYHAFYSPEARAKNLPPPKPAFARLTNRQFRESAADLIGSFSQAVKPGKTEGLRASYFQSDGMNKKARKVMDRVDAKIDFDFGANPPVEGMNADQYSIAWDGALFAPETGWYEFKITTPNGARLYLNRERQDGDGNFRDDSGAKRAEALIDAWVSSGPQVREEKARIFLLGGRWYLTRLDYFKYQEPRGMIRLEWKVPRGAWSVVNAPSLANGGAPHVAICSTAFPPDDASEGYERGTGISKDWHDATTTAAIELANYVAPRVNRMAETKDDDPSRESKVKAFLSTFATRAFRRPLDDEAKRIYVDAPFAKDVTLEQAVKRSVLLILKSPRFLYPEAGDAKDAFTVANRLALGLWDSLPDKELLEAAKNGQLQSPEQVKAQATRMAVDPRTKAKLNEFFQHWLKLDVESDLTKDAAAFPGFDEALVSDLRESLELFVENVIWNDASDYRELLQSENVWFNARLGKYYGVDVPDDGAFHAVQLDPGQRAGVLTHPFVLARLAHPDITSPIHRGVFLTRNVLGNFLKPPPEAITFENHKFDPHLSMREKVSLTTRNKTCMTCHETINPLGFSLENFDPVGRFRTTENDKPIDSAADYLTNDGEVIHLHGARDVATHAVQSTSARQGFIRQVFQYMTKQNPAVYGYDRLHKLDEGFVTSNCNVRQLLVEIVATAAMHDIPDLNQANR